MELNSQIELLIDSGLWDSKSDDKHGFQIGIEPFDISQYLSQFKKIGDFLPSYYEGLVKTANYISGKSSKISNFLLPIFKKGKDGYPFISDFRFPPLIKVDIIVDAENNLRIVEIDGYNPRGIAYALLLNDLYSVKNNFIATNILDVLKLKDKTSLFWIYPERERFYLRSYEYLQNKFKLEHNIDITLLNANSDISKDVNLDYIFIGPWGLSKPNELKIKEKLIAHYLADSSNFFYPLKPWLNNKLFMSFPFFDKKTIFDDNEIIQTFKESFQIGEFMPQTYLIGKRIKTPDTTNDFVLKEGVSSGHKSVFFSGSPRFNHELALAKMHSKPTYIFQKEVNQRQFVIPVYENENRLTKKSFYCRFIAHYSSTGTLLNVDLTGRPEKLVYGAIDSVQLPCIF